MRVQLGDEPVAVAIADRREDPVVRVDRRRPLGGRVVVHRPVDLGRVPQQPDHPQDVRLPRRLENGEVEAPVGRELGGDVAVRRRVHAVPGRLGDAGQGVVVDRRQRMARGSGLENGPQLVDLLEVRKPQLRHEVAAPRQVGDLALLLEDAQRLAHRRDAQADLLRDVLLIDALTRLEVAGHDEPAQRVDGVLLRGPGDRRLHGGHRNAWMPVSAPPMTSAWTSAVPS